jgi:hypothetical protein
MVYFLNNNLIIILKARIIDVNVTYHMGKHVAGKIDIRFEK